MICSQDKSNSMIQWQVMQGTLVVTHRVNDVQHFIRTDDSIPFFVVKCHVAKVKDECNHSTQVLDTPTHATTFSSQQRISPLTSKSQTCPNHTQTHAHTHTTTLFSKWLLTACEPRHAYSWVHVHSTVHITHRLLLVLLQRLTARKTACCSATTCSLWTHYIPTEVQEYSRRWTEGKKPQSLLTLNILTYNVLALDIPTYKQLCCLLLAISQKILLALSFLFAYYAKIAINWLHL